MKKILIIDDNPQNIQNFIDKVSDYKKYYVEIVMSLSDAERSIIINHYDVIVIDIMMPTQTIKNKDELETGLLFYKKKVEPVIDAQKTKILFWSNLGDDVYKGFFLEGTPNNTYFLHKNLYNENHLLEKINSILSEKTT